MLWLKLKLIALSVSACAFVSPAWAEYTSAWGLLPVQSYPPKAYAANPQNWAAVQSHDGVMYFGNPDGVLEFDGVSWRRTPLPGNAAVRSLAVDRNGVVAIGGQREFGYLQRDGYGPPRYISLTSKLHPDDRKFADVWSVLATPGGTYFSSYSRLFRWNADGSIRVWKPGKSFGRAFLVKGEVLVTVDGAGLHRLAGDNLVPVAGGDRFPGLTLRSVFSWKGLLMAATREGLFFQQQGSFSAFPTEIDSLLSEYKINTVQPLPDGRLAIGTVRGGLFLLDADARLQYRMDKMHGLPADYVLAICPDRHGALWTTTTTGIARLELRATIFDERLGLSGGALAIARQDETLYAGTQTGLFRLLSSSSSQTRFEPVNGLAETVVALLPTAEGLLAGAQSGLYLVNQSEAKRLFPSDVIWDLYRSRRDPSLLFAASRNALIVFRHTGKSWVKEQEIPSEGREFRFVVEAPDQRLWVATRSGVLRIDRGQTPPRIDLFDTQKGVPSGWASLFLAGDHLVLGTEKGLLRYDAFLDRFVPDTSFLSLLSDGSRAVSLFKEDAARNIWVAGAGYHGLLKRTEKGDYRWTDVPLLQVGLSEVWAFSFDPDGAIWAAGPDGWIARSEPLSSDTKPVAAKALIREIQWRDARQDIAHSPELDSGRPKVPFRTNTVRFEFAVPLFEREPKTQYSVRLSPFDKNWSDWLGETRKDYTGLPEGRYTFHLRARHPQLSNIEESSFSFQVLPPWYRTIWAYILYAIAVATAIWALLRWRLKHLRESNRKLEQIVEERTAEIRRQRDQIREEEEKAEALLLNILPGPVAAELLATGSVEPKVFEEVTVCFTDFVGFTLSGEALDARTVVDALHIYFTAFDDVIARFGLEKLKTIGDAYMYVGGLPKPSASHAVDAVLAALELADVVEEMRSTRVDISWMVRIGAHTGAVAAGVVGKNKFTFDIWGDTVNLASRMETSSLPGRVNISAAVYHQVKDFIRCEPRGLVPTKEGRLVEMYFAIEPRQELLTARGDFARLYRERFGVSPRSVPGTTVRPLAEQSA